MNCFNIERNPNFKRLASLTHFDAKELRLMHSKFQKLCNGQLLLSLTRFCDLEELQNCHLAKTIFKFVVLDENSDAIDFDQFAELFSVLSTKASGEEKLKCEQTKVEYLFNY